MNLKIQTSTLVASVSGVLVAFLMIAINNIPAPFKPAQTSGTYKLMALQFELAKVRTQLNELKAKNFEHKNL